MTVWRWAPSHAALVFFTEDWSPGQWRHPKRERTGVVLSTACAFGRVGSPSPWASRRIRSFVAHGDWVSSIFGRLVGAV
jgi:hypothetical protein